MKENISDSEKNITKYRIILVVGNSRSGTTMMGRVFGNHPLVFTFNELHFFEELWDPHSELQPINSEQATLLLARLITIQRDGYYYQKDPKIYLQEAGEILKGVSGPATPPALFKTFLMYETKRYGKKVACLQTPRNVYYLKEILALYPDAYAVNMIRDPRAVLLSQKKKWLGRLSGSRKMPVKQIIRMWAGYHPITMGLMWRSGIKSGDQFADHSRVYQIRFEDLLNHPEEQMRVICANLELEFKADMLEVPHVGSSNRPDYFERKGIDPSVADRWRQGGLLKAEMYIVDKLTVKNMSKHGYVVTNANFNPIMLLLYGVLWVPKMGLALLLNMNRIRNFFPALKKRLLN
jgi:hypothetical protein